MADGYRGGVGSDIALRGARRGDYDGIIGVVDDWWGRPVRQALPRLFLDHFCDTSFIAESRDGELAGFCVGFLSPARPEAAYIQFVAVAPARRGSGLARRLYEAFFALAAERGRTVARAVTGPANADSVAFHSALGFTVTGPVPDYDGPGSPKIVFERPLP
ncbi:MAG: GNAT family N-acetyltransferase [Nocardiopsaceae bacterium]|nr:GNAT family N-acetyltransferase [Nocardiopsaceae bacterium]